MFQPRLGVSFADVSPEVTTEGMEAVAASAIATVEVAAWLFQSEHDPAVMRLAALFAPGRVRPLTIHARFGPEFDPSSPERGRREGARRSAREALALAEALGAPMVVFHISAEPIGADERPARRAQALRSLQEIGAFYQAAGKRLALELLPRSCLGNTLDELLWFMARLDDATFGICLDTNHGMERYASLPDMVRGLGERLFTTHLSDYDGVDEKHWLPGRGVVDWASLLAALDEIDYQGPFNYECHPDGETPAARVASYEANFRWLMGLRSGGV